MVSYNVILTHPLERVINFLRIRLWIFQTVLDFISYER